MFKNYKKNIKNTKRISKRSTRKNRPIPTAVKKYVSRALIAKTETKIKSLQNTQYYNSTVSSTSELYNILPTISRGTADDERIGNSINLSYTNIRGYVTFSDLSITPYSTLDICLYHLVSKRNRDGNNRTSADLNFIKNGTTKIQFDGTMTSSLAPINTEDFTIISKKTFKLIPLPFSQPVSGGLPTSTSILAGNSGNGRNIYKFKLNINWSKVLNKRNKIYYDDSGNQPTSLNSFYCLGFAQYADPTSSASSLDTPVKMSLFSDTYYKDP